MSRAEEIPLSEMNDDNRGDEVMNLHSSQTFDSATLQLERELEARGSQEIENPYENWDTQLAGAELPTVDEVPTMKFGPYPMEDEPLPELNEVFDTIENDSNNSLNGFNIDEQYSAESQTVIGTQPTDEPQHDSAEDLEDNPEKAFLANPVAEAQALEEELALLDTFDEDSKSVSENVESNDGNNSDDDNANTSSPEKTTYSAEDSLDGEEDEFVEDEFADDEVVAEDSMGSNETTLPESEENLASNSEDATSESVDDFEQMELPLNLPEEASVSHSKTQTETVGTTANDSDENPAESLTEGFEQTDDNELARIESAVTYQQLALTGFDEDNNVDDTHLADENDFTGERDASIEDSETNEDNNVDSADDSETNNEFDNESEEVNWDRAVLSNEEMQEIFTDEEKDDLSREPSSDEFHTPSSVEPSEELILDPVSIDYDDEEDSATQEDVSYENIDNDSFEVESISSDDNLMEASDDNDDARGEDIRIGAPEYSSVDSQSEVLGSGVGLDRHIAIDKVFGGEPDLVAADIHNASLDEKMIREPEYIMEDMEFIVDERDEVEEDLSSDENDPLFEAFHEQFFVAHDDAPNHVVGDLPELTPAMIDESQRGVEETDNVDKVILSSSDLSESDAERTVLTAYTSTHNSGLSDLRSRIASKMSKKRSENAADNSNNVENSDSDDNSEKIVENSAESSQQLPEDSHNLDSRTPDSRSFDSESLSEETFDNDDKDDDIENFENNQNDETFSRAVDLGNIDSSALSSYDDDDENGDIHSTDDEENYSEEGFAVETDLERDNEVSSRATVATGGENSSSFLSLTDSLSMNEDVDDETEEEFENSLDQQRFNSQKSSDTQVEPVANLNAIAKEKQEKEWLRPEDLKPIESTQRDLLAELWNTNPVMNAVYLAAIALFLIVLGVIIGAMLF